MSSGINATITRGILPSVDYMKLAGLNAGSHVYVFGDKSYDIYDTDQGGSVPLANGKYAHPVSQSSSTGVSSVNGRSGAVTLTKNDVQLNQVDNTSDVNKPVSTAQQSAFDLKVDKVTGKQLSDENYSLGEKNKLAAIDDTRYWKGEYKTLLELQTAHPTATAGSYAFVDGGVGSDVQKYIWDTTDTKWVLSGSTTGSETPASIKQKYESNPDTNAFSDNAKAAVDGLPAALDTKVNKVAGKALSSNDYTDEDKALVGTISSKLETVPVATSSTFGGFKYTLTDGGTTLNLFTS